MAAPSFDRFATLYRIGRELSSSLELDRVLEVAMDSLIEVSGAERGFIMLLERDGSLAVRVARNLDHLTISAQAFQISRTLVRQVAETGKPTVVVDALTDAALARAQSVASFQLRSIMCAPLQVKGRVTGVAYVDNRLRSGSFGEADLELLSAFADLAAIAIDNARLYEDARQRMREIATMKDFQDNIFRSVGSAIVTIDLEGRISSFNAAAEVIFGTPAVGALGQVHSEVFGEVLTSQLFRPIMRASRPGGQAVNGLELTTRLPRREPVYLTISVTALRSPEGQVLGVVLTAEDHTEERLAIQARRLAEADRERVRDVFGRFVAQGVVEQLLADPASVHLGGKRQQVTVLFSDIRGFTGLSERLPPEEMVALLNQYLAIVTKAIFAHEGTLDKYIGDAVMAIFNAPLPQPDHALRAARAALAAAHEVRRVSEVSSLPLRCGIGINTGDAVVGNIGTEQLMNYTVIGDTVNVAARLQAIAQGGEVLVSAQTYQAIAGQVQAEPLPPLQVKGREQPVEVYRLLDV